MTDAAPAPHLFVDLQVTQSTAYGERGMPRYAGELAAALYEDGAPIAGFGLNPRLPPPARLPKSVTTSGLLVWNTIAEFRRLAASGPLTTLLTCPFFEEHPIESVLPRHMLLGSAALAAVVYDLIPYAMPQRYQQTVAEQRLYGLRHELVRRADVLLALSEHTRRDVIDRFGVEDDKVVVIGAGASEFFRPPVDARDATHEVQTALPDVTQPFVLGVGGADPRKNWAALVRGFAALPATLRDELQLVVVSNPVIRDTLRTLLEETGLPAGRVVLASNVSDALLRALYQSAALFVLPSVYEGFGLPALEAVRCGCPAITSNATSLPEVLQFPPATFPPHDVEALSGLMRRALEDEPFRSELVEAGRRAAAEHTWPRVAGRSLRALEGIRVGPSARPIPRRVAILGVGTTDGDSVAGLPIGVLDAVADRVDLDCFETGDHRVRPLTGRRWRVFPMQAFGLTFSRDAYDAVLTVFDGRADDALAGQFVEAPGIAYLRADPRESRDIIEFASGLLFPSEAARRSARETDLARLPHAVLRLPVPSGRGAPEPLAAKPVLVVPGAMPGDERLDRIVEAFALVLPDWRGRLLFLGSADPASRRRLMDSGRRLGVEREVSWTDRVPHDEYRGRLAAAWCAVCLGARWSSGGDRPLLDALAAGIPVVSDRADAAELAEDGVVALAGPAPVGELAAALRGLLEPAARSARAAEARRYAATWNASAFADALVASLEDLAAPARPFVAAP